MTRAQAMPSVMIALSLASAFVYAWDGDVRRTVYWLAAAALNAAVTF